MLFRENKQKNLSNIYTVSLVIAIAASVTPNMAKADFAEAVSNMPAFISDGTPYLKLRYRYEYFDDSSFAKEAQPSTLRSVLGFKSGEFLNGVTGQIEFENVALIADDDYYNDGSNGKTQYPSIIDPKGTEINQAFVNINTYQPVNIRFGRQEIAFDNQRFIGISGWRQNNQTFDGAKIDLNILENIKLSYAYIYNINRVYGDDSAVGDWDSSSHLVNLNYNIDDYNQLSLYSYMLDIEDSAVNSSKTYGGFYSGKYEFQPNMNVNYRLEYATQSDNGKNTNNYDADYYNITLGTSFEMFDFAANYEVKEGSSNANSQFRTPLGSNYNFNGYNMQFDNTPAEGIEDINFKAKTQLSSNNALLDETGLTLGYHMLEAENGGADYGDEINFTIDKSFGENYYTQLKLVDFSSDNASYHDVTSVSVQLGVEF